MSFQYISCYCLSSVIQVDRFHASSFQYISCYCLSYLRHVYSHLSLNFNTSHVTVYRYHSTSFFFATFISIHLMLLFIKEQKAEEIYLKLFQYISCYCLSHFLLLVQMQLFNFNTSHVTVYLDSNHVLNCPSNISIHLMLLFIVCQNRSWQVYPDFNTSHVTVYLIHIVVPAIEIIFQYISCYCLSNELTPFYIFLRI